MPQWSLKDLIDLELLMDADRETDEESLARRDRALALQEGLLPPKAAGPCLHRWLQERRAVDMPSGSPGDQGTRALKILALLLTFFGMVSGGSAAVSLLRYSGSAPINVSWFIVVMILSQVLLLGLLVSVILIRTLSRTSSPHGLWKSLWQKLLRRSGGQRPALERLQGLMARRGHRLGAALQGPLWMISQLFAVGFNLGALGATLVLVLTSDLAFGWQTTLNGGPAGMHQFVHTLAAPWRALVPEAVALPSLAQVEGSRIVLKEGVAALATRDLASWWPFLCWGMLFYGLLPRLIFILGAALRHHLFLSRLRFQDPACASVLLRMQTPLVSASSDPAPSENGLYATSTIAPDQQKSTPREIHAACWLVETDLADEHLAARLTDPAREKMGLSITQILIMGAENETPDTIAEKVLATHPEQVALLIEAAQPPLLEHREILQQLRAGLGRETLIQIVLTARSQSGTPLVPISGRDQKIWLRAAEQWGDPYVGVTTPGGLHV